MHRQFPIIRQCKVYQKNDILNVYIDVNKDIESINDDYGYDNKGKYINIKAGEMRIISKVFRNDFAFSIAIHIMNNNTTGEFATALPGSMTYILDRDLLVRIAEDKMQFLVEKEMHRGEYTAIKTTGMDVHVMNKRSLDRHYDTIMGALDG